MVLDRAFQACPAIPVSRYPVSPRSRAARVPQLHVVTPRATLLLALWVCTSAAPVLHYVGCGQTSSGFQATVAVATNSTSTTLIDPTVSTAFNYSVLFTNNGGFPADVPVLDGLATLAMYTGPGVTAQLQMKNKNGATDIVGAAITLSAPNTTCIKIADYVGCGAGPKTTAGFSSVQVTLSNPNVQPALPAAGTSVVYSTSRGTGTLLACNDCSDTRGCFKGGTASVFSIPGVLNKPSQYVYTQSCQTSNFTFANGKPVSFGTGVRASLVNASTCLTLPKLMGCGQQIQGTSNTGQLWQVQLYHKAPPAGADAVNNRATVHYGFQQYSVTCEDCSALPGCHVGSGADEYSGYGVTTIQGVYFSPLKTPRPRLYARVCANSTAVNKVFGTEVFPVKISSPSTQCVPLPKLGTCSKFAAAASSGGKSTYSWSFTGPSTIAYQPTTAGSPAPPVSCNNCAAGNSRGCVINNDCNDAAKCCTRPGAIGKPPPTAFSVFTVVGCQTTTCSSCKDTATGRPLYVTSGVLPVGKKSFSCSIGTQDAANGGCAASFVTTTAPPPGGGSESLRLGLGLGLGLGLPVLAAVAYAATRGGQHGYGRSRAMLSGNAASFNDDRSGGQAQTSSTSINQSGGQHREVPNPLHAS